jgi:photosynthetic reaction center H subunit
MGTGAITQYVDVASLVFTLFIIFFLGLVRYITLESKREGFPLESQQFGEIHHESGLLGLPKAKHYHQKFGKSFQAPLAQAPAPEVLNATPAHHNEWCAISTCW